MVPHYEKQSAFFQGLSDAFTTFKAATANGCGVLLFCAATALGVLANQSLLAQQPHVAAPNKPVPPELFPLRPLPPAVAQSMVGGPWLTNANYHSVLVIKNQLKTSPLQVRPILYLANGRSYALPEVVMEAAGVTTLDINQALAKQGVAPWAALSGYLELQYQWPWDALCATIQNLDPIHSEVFTYNFRSTNPDSSSGHQNPAHSMEANPTTVLEGLWWKQEPNVTGFVAVSNVSSHSLAIHLDVSDRAGDPIADHELTVASHETKFLQLPELSSAATHDGGIRATFAGQLSDLLIEGGLEDSLTGYSANVTFAPSAPDPSTASSNQYALLGLMVGAAEPMLKFPAGTIFIPYANLRNISAENARVTPVIWWMEGAAPRYARLAEMVILPFHSASVDFAALLSSAGLEKFRGSINLVLETAGPLHSLLVASGSVDQKNTYVFSVPPSATRESVAKALSYWSTGNGDDTMVTLWNPADDPQDFTFTLFFAGGRYELPLHMEGRVSRSFNISEIIENEIPDPEGRTIPITVHEGSAEIAGSKGANQHILAAMAAGTYNVVKATCQWYCVTCQGAVTGTVSTATVGVGQSKQLSFTIHNHDGSQFDDSNAANWSSSNGGVATVSATGLAYGVAVGSVTINCQRPSGARL